MNEVLITNPKPSRFDKDLLALITFEESELGSYEMFDQVKEKVLESVRSTAAGSTDAAVINDPVHGKVMRLGTGRFWRMKDSEYGFTRITDTLKIEIDFIKPKTNNTTGTLVSTVTANNGLRLYVGSPASPRCGAMPENSGSAGNAPFPDDVLFTSFLDRNRSSYRYGWRGGQITGPYRKDRTVDQDVHLFSGEYHFTPTGMTLIDGLTWLVKEIRIRKDKW